MSQHWQPNPPCSSHSPPDQGTDEEKEPAGPWGWTRRCRGTPSRPGGSRGPTCWSWTRGSWRLWACGPWDTRSCCWRLWSSSVTW
uniref:Uncharacterized protein n=1 Tax=Serinus canaria TaxID=9135 RepID=A0A8C9UB10_SERCA